MAYKGTFRYRGGKSYNADFIIDQCPEGSFFVDLFGGSGCISLAAVHSKKYRQVVYNDLDKWIYTTLTTIRDDCGALLKFLAQTPIARESCNDIYTLKSSGDPVKMAAGCIIQLCMSSITPTLHMKRSNGFLRPNIKSVSSVYSGKREWHTRLQLIRNMQEDLLEIVFENKPWQDIAKYYLKRIPSHARPETIHNVFIADPPYGETLGYNATADGDEVIEWFKADHPNTTKILCNLADVEGLEQYTYLPFTYTATSSKDKLLNGIYINSNDTRPQYRETFL